MLGALAAGAGAILGGIAGGQGSKTNQSEYTSSTVKLRNIKDLNRGRSGLEAEADTNQLSTFKDLAALLQQGPGQSEVQSANAFSNQFATNLESMLNGPNANQIAQAQQFAQNIFAPQQVAMQQAFADQTISANRLAARLGRSGNDPVLRNKLAQEQTRQSAMLNAQQGAFAAQTAQNAPQNYLAMGGALANLKQGLASQAFQNRQILLTMGNQLAQAERNYRLQTATREGYGTQTTTSGGGLAGIIGGALAGAGGGLDFAGKFGSMGKQQGGGGNAASGFNTTPGSVVS